MCFKSPINYSCIGIFLTNWVMVFKNTRNFEIGMFDFHEMVLIVHKVLYKDPKSNDKWQMTNMTNDKLKQFPDHF